MWLSTIKFCHFNLLCFGYIFILFFFLLNCHDHVVSWFGLFSAMFFVKFSFVPLLFVTAVMQRFELIVVTTLNQKLCSQNGFSWFNQRKKKCSSFSLFILSMPILVNYNNNSDDIVQSFNKAHIINTLTIWA